MSHDFNDAAGYRTFGPRWPLMEPSKGNQRQVVHWAATDEAKAMPYRNCGDYRRNCGDKNELTKREFWDACTDDDKKIMKQFAEVFDAKWEGEQ
jgi:hypothetical protein